MFGRSDPYGISAIFVKRFMRYIENSIYVLTQIRLHYGSISWKFEQPRQLLVNLRNGTWKKFVQQFKRWYYVTDGQTMTLLNPQGVLYLLRTEFRMNREANEFQSKYLRSSSEQGRVTETFRNWSKPQNHATTHFHLIFWSTFGTMVCHIRHPSVRPHEEHRVHSKCCQRNCHIWGGWTLHSWFRKRLWICIAYIRK
jgi:hypothetical protein